MSERKVTSEEQALIDAQHARTYARESFYAEFARLTAALRNGTITLDAAVETIQSESRHVSKTLNDVDGAILDRVQAMTMKAPTELAQLRDDLVQLRAEIAELRREIAAGSEP